jgi:hypothetical protein
LARARPIARGVDPIMTKVPIDYSHPSRSIGFAPSAWPVVALYSAAQTVIGFLCLWISGAVRVRLLPAEIARAGNIAAAQYWLVVALCAVYCGAAVAIAAGIVCIVRWRARGGPMALKAGIIAIAAGAAMGGLLLISR